MACGGDSSSSNNGDTGDNRDGGSSGPTIRGGERIGWDQPVNSRMEALGYTFLVYVDGTPRPLTEVQCSDERSAGGVACSARLPAMSSGRHTLEMSASVNGFESQRSQPITVSVASGLQAVTIGGASAPVTPPAADKALTDSAACVATNECYQQHQITSGLGVITAPLNAGNILFFVENGRTVRTLVNDVPQAEVALSVGADSRITGLAAAPDFNRTHRVYVAWTERSSGLETLNITRYRELGGVLAEGATIVSGLPMPPDGVAPIAVDDARRIYLALPAMQKDAVGPPAELSNHVLRFADDGSVPGSNPAASPVLALGYGRPAALVWDGVSRQLWMSGADILSDPVTAIPVDEVRADWPWIPQTRASGNVFPVPPTTLSLTSGPTLAEPRFLWLAAVDRMIRLRLDSNEVTSFGQTELSGSSVVIDGPGDSLYVFGPMTPDGSFRIMRWDRIPSVSPLRRR